MCGSGVLLRDMSCLFWRFAPERRKKNESCQPLQHPSRGTHSNLVSNVSCICDLGCVVFNLPTFFCLCECRICRVLLVIFCSFYNRMEIKAIYSALLRCIIAQAMIEKKKGKKRWACRSRPWPVRRSASHYVSI